MLTIPRLLCKTSEYVISTLHHGNSWSFVVAKTVEIGAIPAVSRGTVSQHEVRMTALQFLFQPFVDEDLLLLN